MPDLDSSRVRLFYNERDLFVEHKLHPLGADYSKLLAVRCGGVEAMHRPRQIDRLRLAFY